MAVVICISLNDAIISSVYQSIWFCDESNDHPVSKTEFLVQCSHDMLKEDAVMELRTYAR